MIIGITGGIGSGKSVIAKQLREMGYAVYDTDSEAKRLIVEDAAVRKQMIQLFGSDVYKDGIYQTAFVAQRVFTDKSLLAQLNAIVHPAIRADILRWATMQDSPSFRKGLGVGLCFVECAILYQAGFDSLCDKVVAVTAPEDIRLKRVIARDHSTIDKVRARMRAQSTEQDLLRADIVVNNDGQTPISTLCEQILHEAKAM
ncbi:MAG: dephospho-CoA kinase [Paludibacteraceae bacterium]|nr:dephospho-CoA kinase [Paludibacteraceae bacterium]